VYLTVFVTANIADAPLSAQSAPPAPPAPAQSIYVASDTRVLCQDATYRGVEPLTLTFGRAPAGTGCDFRIFEGTAEHVWRLAAGAIGSQWITLRFANRTRSRFSGQVDVGADERWIVSANFLTFGFAGDEQALARTVAALQELYRHNVFPAMKVTWGSYPDNRGHLTATGCFRCHDGSHADANGAVISADCESCHRDVTAPPPGPGR
jgi:hypothetical protein